MERWLKCTSFLLGSFLLFSFLCGFISTGFGIAMQLHLHKEFLDGMWINWTSSLFIVAGLVSIVSSLLMLFKAGSKGCLSRMCTDTGHCLVLIGFFLLVSSWAVSELAGGVISFSSGDLLQPLMDNMGTTLSNYEEFSSDASRAAWDRLQHSSSCCGILNYTDWKKNRHYHDGSVPDSCCIVQRSGCGALGVGRIYTTGCLDRIWHQIEYLNRLSATSGVVLGLLQLLGLLVALTLVTPVRKCFRRAEYSRIEDEEIDRSGIEA